MPKPFLQLSTDAFAERLAQFEFRRPITEVHMHHTFIPDRRAWREHHAAGSDVAVIEGMARFHMEQRGFSDIAQHVSIAPDGTVWTGRDWSQAPASATGFNGSRDGIPFMFETIGNFDDGREPLDGVQRAAVVDVIARVQLAFGLPEDALRFHNEMSGKTCPGNGPTVRKEGILADVARRRAELEAEGGVARARVRRPRGRAADDLDVPDGEPEHESMTAEQRARYFPPPAAAAASGARAHQAAAAPSGRGLSADDAAKLRPHVVNLTDGRFTPGGIYDTTEEDVRAIFAEHLPQWAEAHQSEPLRIVIWAHGGLVDEKSGLSIARKHVDWWKANGAYPIYFVWETGLFDALRSILESVAVRVRPRGRRDFWDYTTDPIVQGGCRALGGVKVWSAMKDDARAANDATGGARFVATRLKEFLDGRTGERDGDVRLHAVGHSAGSIFHSYFLPLAAELGIQPFESLQLLAPAVRVDEFVQRMVRDGLPGGQVVSGAQSLALYTMRKDLERRDNCGGVYRKSLLYLIHHALERESEAAILGLEQSIYADRALRELFGLDGRSRARGRIVWSESEASRSRTHGGFDDDPATMTSVATVVLGGKAPREAYRADGRRALSLWESSDDWMADFDLTGRQGAEGDSGRDWAEGTARSARTGGGRQGRRLALCVGINDYPGQPLEFCVADAEGWGDWLDGQGFEVRFLRNREATYARIRQELERLVDEARAGDVLVFQYAGHGTRLPDVDADEDDDTDEAIVPFDHEDGALLIDDDFRAIFSRVPEGVSLTCFMDCCHSGSNTRIFARSTSGRVGKRARFLRPTDAMVRAHEAFRAAQAQDRAAGRGPSGARGRGASDRDDRDAMRWVSFAACEPWEVALESEGHGDFTRIALRELESAGGASLTHRELQRRIVRAFGKDREQTPRLDCNVTSEGYVLLQGRVPAGMATAPAAAGTSGGGSPADARPATAAAGGGASGDGASEPGTHGSNGHGGDPRQELKRILDELAHVVDDL